MQPASEIAAWQAYEELDPIGFANAMTPDLVVASRPKPAEKQSVDQMKFRLKAAGAWASQRRE